MAEKFIVFYVSDLACICNDNTVTEYDERDDCPEYGTGKMPLYSFHTLAILNVHFCTSNTNNLTDMFLCVYTLRLLNIVMFSSMLL